MDILNSEITIASSYVLVPIPILGIIILALYLLKNRKYDTTEQISTNKLDSVNGSNQQNTTGSSVHHHHHHHHHHHQQQQQQQQQEQQQQTQQQHQSKSAKSAKSSRHQNKRSSGSGNNNSNSNTVTDNKTTTTHPWLASNLKGHTDDIHDIDFSNNGKFLASCSEASNNNTTTTNNQLHHRHHHRVMRNDRRKESTSTDSTGSGAEDNSNISSSNEDCPISHVSRPSKNKKSKSGRSRQRQRKNHAKNISIDENITNKNNHHHAEEFEATSSSSSSSLNSSPTASPQQKSSLRKSPKKSPKSHTNQIIGTNNISHHHHHHHQMNHYQKNKNCELENFIKVSRAVIPPLRQHTKLNLKESELFKRLEAKYIVYPPLLRMYGYPVLSAAFPGCIEIFKCISKPFTHFHTNGTVNINRSNTPRCGIINKIDGLITPTDYKKWKTSSNGRNIIDDACMMQVQSSDSGNGSDASSPSYVDSDDTSENGDEETTTTTFYTADGNYQIFTNYSQSLEKQCVRCNKEFLVNENGEYFTKEECFYHWGKLLQIYTSNRTIEYQYTCCNGNQTSISCSNNRLHVWTGVTVGINGPYNDFVQTKKRYNNSDDLNNEERGKIYALDCEMCFTGLGLEVTKITVISSNGNLKYETFVKPKCEIVDYNTRFSGITEKDITSKSNSVKTLEQVQKDLLQFIDEDTILIGHALDNDLRALKIFHTKVIDTSVIFTHQNGFPYRRALKAITKTFLNRDIQNGGASGHCSFEDSRACLELVLYRVRTDIRIELEQ